MKTRPPRDGYAMVLVLVFLALMLTFYSVSYRHVATTLRAETVRTRQEQRDEGCIQALARGLTLLETGSPPSNPYTCAAVIGAPPDERSFTVSFTSETAGEWSLCAVPTEWPDQPELMPSSFGETSSP